MECEYSGEETEELVSSDESTYTVTLQCYERSGGGECLRSRQCRQDPPGFVYTIKRDGISIGQACLSAAEAAEVGAITPEMVLREFKRLSWPTAELTLAPPGGETLVNLPTIFSTDLASPQTQTITLLGQAVTIEATPTSFTWHAGDGSSWVTEDPGAPWSPGADVDTLNTHTYLAGSTTVDASVDVTYAGRYRVGDGAWQTIPDTLTLTGDTVAVYVREAANNLTRG